MTALAIGAAERRRNTRKALRGRIQELEARLAASAGETRKGMRERLARLVKEKTDLEHRLKSECAVRDARIKELVDKLEAAKKPSPGDTTEEPKN